MGTVDDLGGKTVLLTGASKGLGPHIARRLHRAGAKFVLSAPIEEALVRWPRSSASPG